MGQREYGRPATGPKRAWPWRLATQRDAGPILRCRARQQNQGWLHDRVREHPLTAQALGYRTHAAHKYSAAVMSRGMVMAESSVVTATIRVLNR